MDEAKRRWKGEHCNRRLQRRAWARAAAHAAYYGTGVMLIHDDGTAEVVNPSDIPLETYLKALEEGKGEPAS